MPKAALPISNRETAVPDALLIARHPADRLRINQFQT
jgi:hypothetical protein